MQGWRQTQGGTGWPSPEAFWGRLFPKAQKEEVLLGTNCFLFPIIVALFLVGSGAQRIGAPQESDLPANVRIVKAMVFPIVVYIWELDHKEGWVPKNWCFWTVVLEKTLESPLDCKVKPVHPKGNQPWIFTGRTDAEAEAPILWPPDVKSWLIGKDSDAGKDLRARGEGGDRGWDDWMTSLVQWTWIWAKEEMVKDREAWCAAVHGVAKSRTQLSHWTTTACNCPRFPILQGLSWD